MGEKPLLSFVVPTHNCIAWLPECIQSLLSQTVENIEVVIVNDGSNDGTKEFLDDWAIKQPRVKVIHNETNLGAGPSRNIGMQGANSEIIGVSDADDCYPIERAEYILKHFELNPDSELVNFPYVRVGYFGEILERFDGVHFDHEAFKKEGSINYFCNPSVAYKKKAVMDVGGYPKEDDKQTDDIQFVKRWIDAGKRIDFQPGHYMCLHRVLPDSMMVKHRGFDPKWVEKK